MLDSKNISTTMRPFISLLIALPLLFVLTGCLPQASSPSVDSSSTVGDGGSNNPPALNYPDPAFPLSGIFIQEGATQTKQNFAVPLNFSDSFLVRGLDLSAYLKKLPNTTKFCLVGKFTYSPGFDKFLVLAAKPKSFTDLTKKTTEHYLQVEPANDSANQNDCLSYNLSNSLFTNASNPSLSFSLTQLCSGCSSAVSSTPLKLFFINGEEVPELSLGTMFMTISGDTSSTGNSCVENSVCRARGYDCCLQGQCVKDGALRPSINVTDPAFLAAQHDVTLNPARFVLYPQFYFVCESRPEHDSGSTGGSNGSDPDYEAAVRIREQTYLYQCLNKVDGEFSYCTVKFTEASDSTTGNFSASDAGFKDDINFTLLNTNLSTGDYKNNIVKIVYGGQVLYELNKTSLTGAAFTAPNDDLASSQGINLTAALPSNAQDDHLYLTYKVDGTCEKIGATMARCSKTYIQASSDSYNTTWHNSSKTYRLPAYADLSATASVIVKVSGIVVPEDTSTWVKSTSPNSIVFNPSYQIFQNQTVEIFYFVNSNASELLKMRSAAQSSVNTMCSCGASGKCNLKPVLTDGAVTSYECVYPTASSTEPPANQTVFVSNKTAPHRYYDANGVNYDEDYSSALAQELAPFAYTNNDLLKPNNVSQFVGFNEIYGSFAKSGLLAARPAKMVRVKKDKLYDIIASSGGFSTCATCGNDYYSSLQKLFPSTFSAKGGGYTPDYYESKRENSQSNFRSDDLLFGRACFVPASMIPWTHSAGPSPKDQRRSRLAGQHFLHANGYARDWYGFDYGSLIGSFDGVTWFSIGNERRIKASTGRLYLAVNGFFADLSGDSSYSVVVSEASPYSSEIPDHDTETDGAECQRAHFCSTDNDCFRQLGYDYSCQNVTGLTTAWPQFDANGAEISGSLNRSLVSIVGGTNGQSKRCVYRGKGAPCHPNLFSTGSTFNGSSLVGTLMCSSNNTCADLSNNIFNDRIARFGKSPTTQNYAEVVTPPSDTVGLGARIIGRPFDYYGTKSAPAEAAQSLADNNVGGVCVPGKDLAAASRNYDLNWRIPAVRTESSDKIFGVGPTLAGNTASSKYLNACPATDDLGASVQLLDLPLGHATLNKYTIAQNMSSNLLTLPSLSTLNIFSSTGGSQITSVGYQRNTCLRAPGASCFSDMECAPSDFIASRVKQGIIPGSEMNQAEQDFWKEELICGNPELKFTAPGDLNPDFTVQKNKCCRDFGKSFTMYTTIDSGSPYQWCSGSQINVAGVNAPLNSPTRYSRVHTGHDKMTCDVNVSKNSTTIKFALSMNNGNTTTRLEQVLEQYKTLDMLNSRTCCTENWVRSFDEDNGGDHSFGKNKMQTIDKAMFKHINWFPDTVSPWAINQAFHCDDTDQNFANSSCEIRAFNTDASAEKYLTWAGTLELLGIPQVAVKTNDEIYKLVTDGQGDPGSTKAPLVDSDGVDVFADVGGGHDFADSTARYYSAANMSKFSSKLKKVFSADKFNCCLPSGTEVPETVGNSQCCTGYVANVDGPRRCCLPDYTNVTVYLNRYVSSEGRGLPDSAYDPKTGFIKDPGQVQLLAAQKGLCCSETMTTGVVLNHYSIPIIGNRYAQPVDSMSTSRRFNYRTDIVDNNGDSGNLGSFFDAGLRWNNHVYCVPADFGEAEGN